MFCHGYRADREPGDVGLIVSLISQRLIAHSCVFKQELHELIMRSVCGQERSYKYEIGKIIVLYIVRMPHADSLRKYCAADGGSERLRKCGR